MKKYILLSLWLCLCFGSNWGQSVRNQRTGQSYPRLQKAIQEANPHDILELSEGTYQEETIVMDKPISLIGKGKAILDGQEKREILQISADSVTIRNLSFKDVGESFTKDFAAIRVIKSQHFKIVENHFENVFYGIFCEKSSDGRIEKNTISGNAELEYKSGNGIHLWSCQRIEILNNEISKLRDGIYFEFVDHSLIQGNNSHHNLRYGLHFMFSNHDVYLQNTFNNNGAGVAVMFSKFIEMYQNTFSNNWGTAAYGLLLKEIYDGEIKGNTFVKNTIGINAEGSNRINYQKNTFSENGWAVRIKGACFENHFTHNNFLNNSFDISYSGNLNDNTFNQNYWSDYSGYDLDKNGFGDVPYRPVKLFSYVTDKSPESIILLRSLFVDIINFSEKVAPVFTPDNLMDNQPLMRKIL